MVDVSESTRNLVMRSWAGARALADQEDLYRGTAASEAGRYLELAHGDAARALLLLPVHEDGYFWARVASILVSISAEEREPVRRVV